MHVLRQSGESVAWMAGPCYRVQVLLQGRVVTVWKYGASECAPQTQPQFAVAGDRALWTEEYFGNSTEGSVSVASPGGKPRGLESLFGDTAYANGDYVGDAAAAAGRLYYAVVNWRASASCGAGGPCSSTVTARSRLMEVGTRVRRVRALPPALALAGGDDRLALQTPDGIDVYAMPAARRVSRVHVRGLVRELAVSRSVLAVLLRTRIERFDARGRQLGSTPVYASATNLSVSGTRIVYRTGNVVRLLDARSGRSRILAITKSPPIGVSIAGDRIVWAEVGGGRSRIVFTRLEPARR